MTQCRVIGIEWPNWEPLNYILFSVYREDIRKLEEENKFLKAEIELLKKPRFSDRYLKKLEEENKTMKSEIENMKEVGRENIETLDRMSIELENYSKSFKRYLDFSKQELADSLYDSEEQNKKLKERIEELEKDIEELNKMMLFETELEK